jgi:hypothetical protein
MDWQPIETAPKDGTPIILYATRLGWPGRSRVCGAFYGNQWRIYGCANGEPNAKKRHPVQWLDEVQPTEWMPLPERPY